MRTCVYTAIAGDYEDLKPHPEVDGVEWVVFLGEPHLHQASSGWQHRAMDHIATSPRMRAKWYKVNPHLVLPEYDVTLWVDASVELREAGFVTEMLCLAEGDGLAMLAHPERDCIYDEAIASLGMPKYDGEPMLQQVAWYWQLGHPRHWGLWAGTIIGRQHCDIIDDAMLEWWRHITHWSVQDQLSLPFVLRFKGYRPATPTDVNLYDNEFFKVHFQPEAK